MWLNYYIDIHQLLLPSTKHIYAPINPVFVYILTNMKVNIEIVWVYTNIGSFPMPEVQDKFMTTCTGGNI